VHNNAYAKPTHLTKVVKHLIYGPNYQQPHHLYYNYQPLL
jgi:hypothetical protein